MATSHEILKNTIERGFSALDAKIALGLLKQIQCSIPNVAVLSSAFTGGATSAAQSTVTGLTIANGVGFNGGFAVVGGRTYKFRLWAPTTVNGSAGLKLDMNGGTATVSSFAAVGKGYTAAAIATLAVTAISSSVVNAATAYTSVEVEGEFVASGSGSFAPRATVNTDGTAPQILTGAYLELTEVAQ